MIRSARRIRTSFSLCVFFLSLSRIILFFHSFGDNRRQYPAKFARGAEAHPDDRATIRSFKTKNINKTRKRRERGGYEREKRNKGKKRRRKHKKRGKQKKRNRGNIFSRASLHSALIIVTFSLPSLLQVEMTGRNDERGGAQEFSVRGFSPRLENTPRPLGELPS